MLIFGSYSTPSFREKAEDFETLRKLTGLRAEFLYIYTREAHPVGGWEVERNRKLEIAIEQPQTEEARLALAKRSRDELKIGIPIAPDTMDDAVAKAYGLVPNGAVVIGRDGKVLAIQRWAEPYALRERINEAVAAPATRPAAQ